MMITSIKPLSMAFGPLLQKIKVRSNNFGKEKLIIILIPIFFSAVKSGMFEGVARLKSAYHEETFPFWWENHTLKFKGYFEIEWVYIKDINNKHFSGLYNI